MTIRDTLAENFTRLKATHSKLKRLDDIIEAGGGTRGTLGRITQKTTGVSIDALEPLAKVYGIEPWQLLAPENKQNHPVARVDSARAAIDSEVTLAQAVQVLADALEGLTTDRRDVVVAGLKMLANDPNQIDAVMGIINSAMMPKQANARAA